MNPPFDVVSFCRCAYGPETAGGGCSTLQASSPQPGRQGETEGRLSGLGMSNC